MSGLVRLMRGLVPVMMVVLSVFVFMGGASAEEVDVGTKQAVLNGVNLTYKDDVIDIYRNTYVVSIDDGGELKFDFDVPDGIKKTVLTNINEAEYHKEICTTSTKSCTVPITNLNPNSGVEITLVTGNDEIVRKTMLGLIVKQNATKEKYEDTELSIGPGSGITIDMSSVAKGMKFNLNPVPIPVKYQKYPDGRSVLGFGTTVNDMKFWEDAANDQFDERISKGDLYKKWKEEKAHQGSGGSLGFIWTVAGYATSYDDNPDKMSGTLQFYVGSGYNYTGQYAIFTYSVTITYGATGEFTMTMVPNSPEPLRGTFDLGVSAGLELYGGVGIGSLASVGVYGAAKFGAGMNILPHFNLNSLYISGEVGLKAKLLGRDVMTFTFTSGTKDFIKDNNANGEVYYTEVNLAEAISDQVETLLANNYGAKEVEPVKLPDGETTWNLTNLNTPQEPEKLLTSENEVNFGDRFFANRIAENVYAHSGTQVIKGHMNTMQATAVFANNGGELNYSVYDWYYGTMSEPRQVAGTGQDFNARFVRGPMSGQSYLVWKRLGTYHNGDSLSAVAASGEIRLARYDDVRQEFLDYTEVTNGSTETYGDVAVTVLNGTPYVFSYTNPYNDPSGLSEVSLHEILVFHKVGENWVRESLGSYTGVVSSFDAGNYDGSTVAVLTVGKDGAKNSHVLARTETRGVEGREVATFDGGWGIRFADYSDERVLVYMKDGALYDSFGRGQSNRVYGSDTEKLPEAPFQIIGDLFDGETMMITYLSSIDGAQNAIGYIRANNELSWIPVPITQVSGNANVSYINGVFLGPNYYPYIIYTVQNYQQVSSWFEDTTADMYALAGKENNRVSILSAEITNLNELAVTTNEAKVNLLIKNTGLFRVNKVSLYLKDKGARDYTKMYDLDIPKLYQGEMASIDITLSEADYREPRTYLIGIASNDGRSEPSGVQSDYPLEAKKGPVNIVDSDYDFRTRQYDRYSVKVKSLGPGTKSGKVVFYDPTNLQLYLEQPFNGLSPGQEFVAGMDIAPMMLGSTYRNFAARVLGEGESLDGAQPTGKFRNPTLLPEWYQPYLNRVKEPYIGKECDGLESCDEEPAVPNTGVFSENENEMTKWLGVGVGFAVVVIVGSMSVWISRKNVDI